MAKSVKLQPALKKRILSPKQSKFSHFQIGERGETIARAWLVEKGYQILDTNSAYKWYELDIIALDPQHDEIVFVEVKTRGSTFFGNPSSAVNRHKLRSLNRAARQYLRTTGLRNDYRFDIISVTPEGVEHFENVTWP